MLDNGNGNDGDAVVKHPNRMLNWQGLKVPAGQWVSLVPLDAGRGELDRVSTRVDPLQYSLSQDSAAAVLESVFRRRHSIENAPDFALAGPSAAPTIDIASIAPTVFIGGNHMSASLSDNSVNRPFLPRICSRTPGDCVVPPHPTPP